MRNVIACLTLFLFGLLLEAGQIPPTLSPTPPTVTPRAPEIEHRLPTDQPRQVSPRGQRNPVDAAQLKRDADELAKLAHSVPEEITRVGKGELPKDLIGQLKRIEKLAKQMRHQLAQ